MSSRHILSTSVLLAALLATGCVAPGSARRPDTPEVAPQWPAAPAPARVRYLRSIGTGADWGISKGFLGRIVDAFTGRRESHLVRPTGVTAHSGVLYVADPGAQALFIFDAARQRATAIGRLGDVTLASPIAVTPGPGETVLLADSVLKRVYAIARDGTLDRVVVADGLVRPAAVAYDAVRQRVYVADSMAHRILVYAPDGRAIGGFGSNGLGDGEFNSPTHLALGLDGSLYVTDALNFRVQVFDPEGRFLRRIGHAGDGAGSFAAPKGVAVDAEGRVIVADAMQDSIQIFNPGGELLLGLGSQGMGPGQFWMPNGLWLGVDNVLYVADAYNQRVQAFEVLPPSLSEAGEP